MMRRKFNQNNMNDTYKTLLQEIVNDKISYDVYTGHTEHLSFDQLVDITKIFYTLGMIKGIEFGSGYVEDSSTVDEKLANLKGVYNFLKNGGEIE